jgi:hypothetical protein
MAEKDFHRVILRKVGVYFEARTEDLCILGTDRETLLMLIDLYEDNKRKPKPKVKPRGSKSAGRSKRPR